jgi:hypothetical protein
MGRLNARTPPAPPQGGYHSDEPLAANFADVVAMGGSVVTIFHSPIAATDAALPLVRSQWKGPIGIYPEAERKDYVAVHKDFSEPDHVSPQEFVAKAKDWVSKGVQIIGGCCGIELEHIRSRGAAGRCRRRSGRQRRTPAGRRTILPRTSSFSLELHPYVEPLAERTCDPPCGRTELSRDRIMKLWMTILTSISARQLMMPIQRSNSS